MKLGSTLSATAWTALWLLGSTACIEPEMTTEPASANQTATVLARVLPGTIDVSGATQQIVKLAGEAVIGYCPEIPGANDDSLCSNPDAGVVCRVSLTTRELRFDGCDADGTSIDGTVRMTGPERGPLSLDFDLSIGGRSVKGKMTIKFGSCDSLGYENLTLTETEIASTLVGNLQSCNGTPRDGDFTSTVNAAGFEPFAADVAFSSGTATIVVTDLEAGTPLYQCTWSPSAPDSLDCQEHAG